MTEHGQYDCPMLSVLTGYDGAVLVGTGGHEAAFQLVPADPRRPHQHDRPLAAGPRVQLGHLRRSHGELHHTSTSHGQRHFIAYTARRRGQYRGVIPASNVSSNLASSIHAKKKRKAGGCMKAFRNCLASDQQIHKISPTGKSTMQLHCMTMTHRQTIQRPLWAMFLPVSSVLTSS